MKAPSIKNISMWNETAYNLEPNSMRLFNEIMEMLRKVKPMRSCNNYVRIWVSEERGTVADMRFSVLEEAIDFFEIDNEKDLNKAFLERYPDEKYWFMLEALCNDDGRTLRLNNFSICIYADKPECIDKPEYDCSLYLQWIMNVLSNVFKQVKSGVYLENVEKGLPYNLRYGTISRKKLYERRPSCKVSILKDLTNEEIDRFIQTIEEEGENYIPKGRIKDITFDMYFDYASNAFNAAGYDTEGMTPYEQFNRYGEDFGGRIFENIPLDTTEGFLYYYDDKHHMGGHPWGLVRGSSRTRIYLWPYLTDEGFYFGFSGNEVFMAYEMVKMYMALKGSGMPVKFCGSKKSIIKYLRQDDLIGIVPSYEIALYRQREFPDQDIEDFMHFYPDEDGDIADAIEWQPIMPVILEI